ncbi:tRNA epoxyqueuosine(34) reductase QueG [Candidatus Vondammii sp. HM_W22]|uniref:tRNA epoxyqueuosine(34) reductase QueG n=1 Tax=Candidatus Vondammii sp. HM_W22 TaxID=2687299 RepID=UPI001F13A855|nr:tRNA epoxyqueuosine(34) reductase QueG [Candidatus Vondammii sp. HM_W22]
MIRQQTSTDLATLATDIKSWGKALGFQQVGIADTDLTVAEEQFERWLSKGHHGSMEYMARHGRKRSRPDQLVPGTLRIISVRMNYLPPDDSPQEVLDNPQLAFISRYALGRDYHKLMRNRLQKLAQRIEQAAGPFGYRAFVDSAPVLEKPLAGKAGLGWTGKHCNIVNRNEGAWFFLGELYTDLPLPVDNAETDHCGRCTACIDLCPTDAIIAPYQLDARRCISYLTIEHEGAIPVSLRPLMGNRIYGCDDCLMACPWNRFAQVSEEPDFLPRNGLDSASLIALFRWSEEAFLRRLEGSPIRRIGHIRWLRNIAVALGNAETTDEVVLALQLRADHPSETVREHAIWAISQHKPAN